MPKYLVERHVPGASVLSPDQLRDIARKSVCALEHMGPEYIWHHTHAVGDRFLCIHEAPSVEAVREHSRRGGFPVTSITEIATTFDGNVAAAPAA